MVSKLDRWVSRSPAYALVPVRLIVGVVAVIHGWPKVRDLGAFIDQLRVMGIPLPQIFGTAAALSEFLGGLALILGLFTRQAAFFFACVMAVAAFRVHWANGFFAKEGGYEYPLVLLVASLSLILGGSGPLSIQSSIYSPNMKRMQPSS